MGGANSPVGVILNSEISAERRSSMLSIQSMVGYLGFFSGSLVLGLIAERMSAGQYRGYEDFISQNTDLKSKQVLEKWYSAERLTCETARKVFLLPDAV